MTRHTPPPLTSTCWFQQAALAVYCRANEEVCISFSFFACLSLCSCTSGWVGDPCRKFLSLTHLCREDRLWKLYVVNERDSIAWCSSTRISSGRAFRHITFTFFEDLFSLAPTPPLIVTPLMLLPDYTTVTFSGFRELGRGDTNASWKAGPFLIIGKSRPEVESLLCHLQVMTRFLSDRILFFFLEKRMKIPHRKSALSLVQAPPCAYKGCPFSAESFSF